MKSIPGRQWFIAAVLWFAVLASAGGAIYTSHRAREQFVESLGDRYVDHYAAECCGEDF